MEAASRLKVLLYKPPTLLGCAPESNHDLGNKIAHCSEGHTPIPDMCSLSAAWRSTADASAPGSGVLSIGAI